MTPPAPDPADTALPPGGLPITPVLMAIFGANGFGFANWFARLPQVKATLGLSDGPLGLALFGMPIGCVVAMPLAAILIARIGAGPTTALATAALGLALAGPGLAGSFWALFAAMLVLGFANGLQDISMNAATSAVERRRRIAIMNRAHAGFSLGGLIGAGTGAVAAAMGVPVALHLTVVSAAILGVTLVAHRTVAAAAPDRRAGPVFALPPPALYALAAMAFAAFFAEGVIADWSSVWLADGIGAAPGVAPLGFAAFSATMVIGRLGGDWLGRRLGDRRLLILGGLLGGGAVLAGGAIGTPVAGIAALGIAGFGFATIIPILFRRAGEAEGIPSGTAIAAVASVGYAGYLTSPGTIGLVAEWAGLTPAFMIVGGLALSVALAASLLRLRPTVG